MNDVCRFSRDHVVECSERTVLSCLEPVCLCWRRFERYFSHHLAKSDRQTEDFHPKVTVDQAEGLCHRITLHFGRLDIETGALYHCI